ncbi:MAG: transcriptional regulator [Candidatus Odinarchaeota archaeon]
MYQTENGINDVSKGLDNKNRQKYIVERFSPCIKRYKRLKEGENLFRTLFKTTDNAVFVLKGDRFIDCNDKTLEMFNCTRDTIVGQTPYSFSPNEQCDGMSSEMAAKEKISIALSGQMLHFDWLHERYDGGVSIAEVTLSPLVLEGEKYLIAIVRETSNRLCDRKVLLECKSPQTTTPRGKSSSLSGIRESLKKNKIFSDPSRLIIIFLLYYRTRMTFTELLEKLAITPGNLGHHIKKLEEAGLVKNRKVITNRVTTVISITETGTKSFKIFADSMKMVLQLIN